MAQYIDKEKIVAEIKGYIFNYKEIVAKTNRNDSTWVDSVSMIDAKIDVLQHVLFFLNTLEVKEVDLEKYYHDFLQKEWFDKDCNRTISEMMAFTAKHFYELGLKVVQKGE